MKGKDALAAGPQVDQDWQKGADQIRNTLTNDRQKLAFENRVGSRYSSLNERSRATRRPSSRTTTIRPRPRRSTIG
jgi:hypothetical protein